MNVRSIATAVSRRLHVSWLIAWTCLGIVGGIALAAAIELPLTTVQLYCLALSGLIVVFHTRSVGVVALAVIAGVCIGFARGGVTQHALTHYQPYIGKAAVVYGIVAEDTSLGTRGEQRVHIRNVRIGEQPMPGEIWISTSSQHVLRRSDRVTVQGVLAEGFGTTPASMYDVDILVVSRPKYTDMALLARDWFAAAVRRAIPEPQASLGVGFLLGQRSSLPDGLDSQLRILGLTHIVVASGYNLTILVRFARKGLARWSKYLALMGSFGLIIGFVLMTGAGPSMSRAALVAGMSLVAWYFGRSIQPLVILAVSAAITACIHPSYVWGDLGWYLSFLSFAGIMMLAPLIQHYFWGKNAQLDVVRRIIIETLSAQLATLPLLAWVFGQYSVLALPANVLILPLVPLAMALTFAAGIGALTLPSLASLWGLPATFVLSYMTMITGWLSAIPWAAGDIQIGVPIVLAGYAALCAAGYYMWRATKHRFSNDNIVV